jgi:hypothetical protein
MGRALFWDSQVLDIPKNFRLVNPFMRPDSDNSKSQHTTDIKLPQRKVADVIGFLSRYDFTGGVSFALNITAGRSANEKVEHLPDTSHNETLPTIWTRKTSSAFPSHTSALDEGHGECKGCLRAAELTRACCVLLDQDVWEMRESAKMNMKGGWCVLLSCYFEPPRLCQHQPIQKRVLTS